jgi:vacuolar-type H+-ATPase subunit F/Vma7
MSLRVVHVGDERSAAGFRLAGARVLTPARGAEAAALQAACAEGELVLLDSTIAAALPPALLREACATLHPLVLVIADVDGAVPVPDIALRLRTQLGLSA